jgi:Tol biopolymer transport system component
VTDILERLRAALADRYRIEGEIGAGGMATVYLADDLKHDRKVAVKVLRPELAAVLGAERFVQEIKTTAHLQHPNILPLFDSGRTGGQPGGPPDDFLYYVMPFVEGETLREKLSRETQLPVDEAVRIATEVAEALDYAHRHTVIHRDIKPENILLHDGRPVVADFGIALAVSAAAGGRMTETGLSLGSPHYMSPEQATAEKELTARSDIYSLGCVLYEMLTGEPPHTGASAQQIIMKIVTEEVVPVTRLRRSVPPHVAAAVAQALEKLPADRFASAADFAAALEGRLALRLPGREAQARNAVTWRWIALTASIAAVACAALAVRAFHETPAAPVTRVGIAFPEGERLLSAPGCLFAISPDGSRFVYPGPDSVGTHQLWVRELNALTARSLPGTSGAMAPFFSPDGQSVAFFTGSPGDLRVVPVAGGPAITIVPDSTQPYGGDWGTDGNLYFSNQESRIARVRATGGAVETLSVLDTVRGQIEHWWPQLLPGGKTALVSVFRTSLSNAEIGLLDFASGRVTPLLQALYGRYLSTGQILYATLGGSLSTVPFDASRSAVTGPPRPLAESVWIDVNSTAAGFAVSLTGTFLYKPGGGSGSDRVVWVDRDGREAPVDSLWHGSFQELVLSPDGSRLAITVTGSDGEQLWVKQLPAGPLTRLTFGARANGRPVWTPDGRRIAFMSDRDSPGFNAWVQRSDGSAEAEPLFANPREVGEIALTPDGRTLLLRVGRGGSYSRDIVAFTPGVDSVPRALVSGPFDEMTPAVSPDGRWLAYVSNESGRNEVYLRRLDDPDAGRTQVSGDGAQEPLWSHSGHELFFRSPGGEMLVADLTLGATFVAGAPRILFRAPNLYSDPYHTTYDLTADDQRFVMVRLGGNENGELVLVLNWFEELKGRVGGRRD